MIVCIEGIDGCGKGEQAARLTKRLGAKLFKFPDRSTPTGALIYGHLEEKWWVDAKVLEADVLGMDEALVFQALQLANRMEHATELFQAAARGNVVLDRYWPSGYAYGSADGLDPGYMVNLHRWLPQPDMFVLLDIDLATSMKRRPERRDRYEKLGDHYFDLVIGHYRRLWSQQELEHKWVVVDGRAPPDEVEAQICRAVANARELGVG